MLNSKRILTIVSNDDLFNYTYQIKVVNLDIASEIKGHTYKGKYGLSTVSDLSFDEVDITKYDGIIIPGGWAPDYLRRLPKVLEFVRYLNEHKKIIGSICIWMLFNIFIIDMFWYRSC